MSNIIFPNSLFALRCLGDIFVPEHQFLSGQATPFTIPGTIIHGNKLSLSLVPDTSATGASWLASDAGSSKFRFSCFADTFLQGDPTQNLAGIVSAAETDSERSVTIWNVIDLDDSNVRLICDGQQPSLFLNGKTVDGTLTLEADESLSGTRWEVVSLGITGDPDSLKVPKLPA
jgi:hypothetical protein